MEANLNANQHGTTKWKSTVSATTVLPDWVGQCTRRHVVAMFLDITVAYVKWIPLLRDLEALGASAASVRTVMSYVGGQTPSERLLTGFVVCSALVCRHDGQF